MVVLLWLVLVPSSSAIAAAAAAGGVLPGTVPCDNNDEDEDPTTATTTICTTVVGPGSECIKGLCSNPFVSGCLRTLLGHETVKPDTTTATITIDNPSSSSSQKKSTSTLRVCNSDDDQEIIDRGLCQFSPLDYMEIRILAANWESSLLTAWVMQIILSEWMHVPTSIESSARGRKANFYHATNQFDYGAVAYDYAALEVAQEVGDCRLVRDVPRPSIMNEADEFVETAGELASSVMIPDEEEEEVENNNYTSCAHVMPEVWNGQEENLWNLTKRRIIEAPEGNGVVGKLTWYIPKYVAELDPELAHYRGWSRNRTQIASSFLRPLTWQHYCDLISKTHCRSPDNVSSRPPLSDAEKGSYYYSRVDDDGSNHTKYTATTGVVSRYQGYFHATEQNNCTAHPNNCTGHFIDFNCDWSSYAVPQIYHLGIPLASNGPNGPNGGYSYGDKLQIWQAANATKSHLVMNWYTPDPAYQGFRGTEAEFQEVQLPPPSPECVSNRVTVEERCSENVTVRVGDPVGSCGAETQTLEKVVIQNLYHMIYNHPPQQQQQGDETENNARRGQKEGDNDFFVLDDLDHHNNNKGTGDAKRSPAYEAVKNFHISEFDIGKMFEDWRVRLRARGHAGYSTFEGTTGADPRHVVCQFVADNAEHLQTFIPFTYPRVLLKNDEYQKPIHTVALVFGLVVSACIVMMGMVTYILRETPPFRHAQLPFVLMVWTGLLTISCGSIVYALPPGRGTCVARSWLITMGYTMELVPLIVKIGAISTMLQAAKRMRRVTIERKKLFGVVGSICFLTAGFLTAWTLVDPPTRGQKLSLQLDDADGNDEYVQNGNQQTINGAWWQPPATAITVSSYCRSSGSPAWFTISIVWQCILLLCATVLAVQTRGMQRRWNESRSLAIIIGTQGGFVIIRFMMWLFESSSSISASSVDVFLSFIFSVDALLALLIYFGSKVVQANNNQPGYDGGSSRGSNFSSGLLSTGELQSNRALPNFDVREAPIYSLENARTISQYMNAIGQPLSRDDSLRGQWARGLVGTSANAGDIIMSKASSRRLNIHPQSFCPECKHCIGSQKSSGEVVASKDDADCNYSGIVTTIREEPEPEERKDTLSTHDDEDSRSSVR